MKNKKRFTALSIIFIIPFLLIGLAILTLGVIFVLDFANATNILKPHIKNFDEIMNGSIVFVFFMGIIFIYISIYHIKKYLKELKSMNDLDSQLKEGYDRNLALQAATFQNVSAKVTRTFDIYEEEKDIVIQEEIKEKKQKDFDIKKFPNQFSNLEEKKYNGVHNYIGYLFFALIPTAFFIISFILKSEMPKWAQVVVPSFAGFLAFLLILSFCLYTIRSYIWKKIRYNSNNSSVKATFYYAKKIGVSYSSFNGQISNARKSFKVYVKIIDEFGSEKIRKLSGNYTQSQVVYLKNIENFYVYDKSFCITQTALKECENVPFDYIVNFYSNGEISAKPKFNKETKSAFGIMCFILLFTLIALFAGIMLVINKRVFYSVPCFVVCISSGYYVKIWLIKFLTHKNGRKIFGVLLQLETRFNRSVDNSKSSSTYYAYVEVNINGLKYVKKIYISHFQYMELKQFLGAKVPVKEYKSNVVLDIERLRAIKTEK